MGHNFIIFCEKSSNFRQISCLQNALKIYRKIYRVARRISHPVVHRKYMHAILVGRKMYALDMPSNSIFTHRQWLSTAHTHGPPLSVQISLADPGEAGGCSINSLNNNSLINSFTESALSTNSFMAQPRPNIQRQHQL